MDFGGFRRKERIFTPRFKTAGGKVKYTKTRETKGKGRKEIRRQGIRSGKGTEFTFHFSTFFITHPLHLCNWTTRGICH